MPKWEGRNEFGLNFQIGKDGDAEIQTDFDVLILIETALNEFVFADFSSSCDDDLCSYDRFQLRSASGEFGLRHNPVLILVDLGNLRCVLDRQRQCCLQTVRALSYR